MNTPFYMTYPIQNLYQADMEYEQDMEQMKYAYTPFLKKMEAVVSDYCDEMEQEGSRMYDEYPDRRMLQKEATNLAKDNQDLLLNQDVDWFAELMYVMYLDEIYRRRCRYRRQHRWW